MKVIIYIQRGLNVNEMHHRRYTGKAAKKVKKGRYIHTLGVEYTSVCLAMKYGANLEAAELAGLLHDCAKELPGKKLIQICRLKRRKSFKNGISKSVLLHGKAGACLAKDKFGVDDEDILNAIRYHTTGRPKMTLIEKIVFVADYIEPNRKKQITLRNCVKWPLKIWMKRCSPFLNRHWII